MVDMSRLRLSLCMQMRQFFYDADLDTPVFYGEPRLEWGRAALIRRLIVE